MRWNRCRCSLMMDEIEDELFQHQAVLLNEAVAALAVKPAGVYVDATFGRGGHALKVMEGLDQSGRLLAIDKDPDALAAAQQKFGSDSRFSIQHGSFAMLSQHVESQGLTGKVSGILLDLGVSSPQLDDAARGFSFRNDGPLDMRMNPEMGESAAQWVARAPLEEIIKVLRDYGEERYAPRIARAIVAAREEALIETTAQLQAIVAQANPSWEKGKDPATRAFQAIRIAVNHELDDLHACLDQALDTLEVGGRLVVISFHSLEDRIVKRFMRDQERGEQFPRGLPVMESTRGQRLKRVGKAIYAGKEELAVNPRARSAVMRVAEKLA